MRLDLPVNHPGFGRAQRCICKAEEDARKLQALSGLTDIERLSTLGDIDTNNRPGTLEMVRACEEFLGKPWGFLVIWGTSGNAKSVALQACVNHMIGCKVRSIYVTAFDLVGHIRAAFDSGTKEVKSQSAYDRLLEFAGIPFLAIDEFDKVNQSAWVVEQITDLIDRRYRFGTAEQVGTVIAMNGNPRDLPMWIYSRLSSGVIVENNDSDLRSYLK